MKIAAVQVTGACLALAALAVHVAGNIELVGVAESDSAPGASVKSGGHKLNEASRSVEPLAARSASDALDFRKLAAGPHQLKLNSQRQAQSKHRRHQHAADKRLAGKLKAGRRNRPRRIRGRRNRLHSHTRHHLSAVSGAAKSAALLAAGAASAAAAAASETAPTTAAALSALESIVEEVARAQQVGVGLASSPAGGGPLAGQSFQAVNGQDLMLGGSSLSAAADSLSPSAAASASTAVGGAPLPQQQPQSSKNTATVVVVPVIGAIQPPPTGTNSRGLFLTTVLSKIMNVLNVTEFALEMRDGISSRASCMACNAVVGLFLSPLYSKEVFSAAIRTVCTSFKIQSPRVCAGLVDAFQDDFEYIRKNTKLSRDEICAVVFGIECARRQTYNLFWTVPIPDYPVVSPDSLAAAIGASNNQQKQQLSSGGGLDDAPDLFEYRKIAPTTQAPADNAASNSASLSGQPSQTDKTPAATTKRSAKTIARRPQYVFDDEFAIGSEQHQRRPTQQRKLSSFVQITDIHIDPYYEEGSLNDCGEALCCRATSGQVPAGDTRRRAGRWGDYGNCDTPVRTLRSALERVRAKHSDAEYWLWTGDISPHDIWNISKAETISHVRSVSKMIRDYSTVPVFPVIGNHEAHPVNSFSPPEIKGKFSMSWLYDVLAEEWSQWLPKEAIKTLRIGGYYKLQIRKGFRILSLNTNYCARLNPWSFYDPVDPANQLKWLASELLEAEKINDKVHIIGHVPPDNRECTQAWLFNFINIVDRFKDTILAQFYGHTHRDEFRVIYSIRNQDDPVGIQYIGPSITPFTENNPAYRVYHQDKSGNLFDFETYFFNLTEANESPSQMEPKWKFAYRVQESLNMTQGLTPTEWNQYVQKLYESDEMFDVFYQNFYRSSDVKADTICRNKCKYTLLSDLRLLHPYKTKPKPFLSNRKTSNHHSNRHDAQNSNNSQHHNNHRHHLTHNLNHRRHKRLRHD